MTQKAANQTNQAAKAPAAAPPLLLQRAAVSDAPVRAVPPAVHDVLRSSGQPLDAATRAYMEPRFGHDFSAVRVHTDAQAAQSAQAVNAHAYTVGSDVAFDAGRYAPGTGAGKRLLAHELTHVVQQDSGSNAPSFSSQVSSQAAEREAEQAGSSVAAGHPAGPVTPGLGPGLARDPKDDPPPDPALRDARGEFEFPEPYQEGGTLWREARVRELPKPSEVVQHRDEASQRALSAGKGEDAGHKFANMFGAPGDIRNLDLQNKTANRTGTWKKLETRWGKLAEEGYSVEASVRDGFHAGETRPYVREVRWKATAPDGTVSQGFDNVSYGNFPTAASRKANNIPPTATGGQDAQVHRLDDYRQPKGDKAAPPASAPADEATLPVGGHPAPSVPKPPPAEANLPPKSVGTGGGTTAHVGEKDMTPVETAGPSAKGEAAVAGALVALQVLNVALNALGDNINNKRAQAAIGEEVPAIKAHLRGHPGSGVIVEIHFSRVTPHPDSLITPGDKFEYVWWYPAASPRQGPPASIGPLPSGDPANYTTSTQRMWVAPITPAAAAALKAAPAEAAKPPPEVATLEQWTALVGDIHSRSRLKLYEALKQAKQASTSVFSAYLVSAEGVRMSVRADLYTNLLGAYAGLVHDELAKRHDDLKARIDKDQARLDGFMKEGFAKRTWEWRGGTLTGHELDAARFGHSTATWPLENKVFRDALEAIRRGEDDAASAERKLYLYEHNEAPDPGLPRDN